MNGFGDALRTLRLEAGMRQQDLVEALDNVIARSTLANVEVGRERPSPRLWEAITTLRPEWVTELAPLYAARQEAPADQVPGPFDLLDAQCVYTFRDDRAPEEIVHLRTVRALADTDGYTLRVLHDSARFDLETESLFGGWIGQHEHQGTDRGTLVVTRFHFDHAMRRGETHQFATRSWMRRDRDLDRVCMMYSRPVDHAAITLNFAGPQPARVWRHGPHASLDEIPDAPRDPSDEVPLWPNGSCTLVLDHPGRNLVYGLSWRW